MGNSDSKIHQAKDPKWQGISNSAIPAAETPKVYADRVVQPNYYYNSHSIKKGKKKVQMKSVGTNSVAAKNKGKSSVKHKNADKYRGPNKKIRKSLIGNPSNFQHTGHIGAGHMRGLAIDPDKVRCQMAEVAAVLNFDETDFGPAWQPTLPGTVPIAQIDPSSEPSPVDAARALLHNRTTYHVPAPPPPGSLRGNARLRSPKSSLKKPNQSSLAKNRTATPKNRVPVGRRPPAALLQAAAQEKLKEKQPTSEVKPTSDEKQENDKKSDMEVVVSEAVEAVGAALTASAQNQRAVADDDGWIDVDEEEDTLKQSFGAFSIPLQATVSTPVQEPGIRVQRQTYVPIPRHEEPIAVPIRKSLMPMPQDDVLVPDMVDVVYKECVPSPPRSYQMSESLSEEYGLITPPDSLRGNPLEQLGSPARYERQDYPSSNRQQKTSNSRSSFVDDGPMLGRNPNGYVMSPSRSIPVRDENPHDRYNRQRRHTGSSGVDRDFQQNYHRQRTSKQNPLVPSGPEPVRQRRESFVPPSPSWHSQSHEQGRDEWRRSDGMQFRKGGVEDSRRSSMQGYTKHQNQNQSDLNLQMYHQYQQDFQRQMSSKPMASPRQQREYDQGNPALAPLVINF